MDTPSGSAVAVEKGLITRLIIKSFDKVKSLEMFGFFNLYSNYFLFPFSAISSLPPGKLML